jgi:RsmE family RNA methyltransferase
MISRPDRLYRPDALAGGGSLRLGREQSHYLAHVLRLSAGARLLVFNGRDGEWLASIASADKKGVELRLIEQTRAQPARAVDLHSCFAPLKHARLDYMVQKAVEMGVSMLRPVMTRHTQVARVNRESVCKPMPWKQPSNAACWPSLRSRPRCRSMRCWRTGSPVASRSFATRTHRSATLWRRSRRRRASGWRY